MTDLRKAAKGALEALTNCNSAYGHRCIRCDSEVDEGGKVASALRAALAQQEEPVWMHPWPPVRAQQDEPVQEPVAWLYEAGADSTLHWNKPPLYGTPLYLAPPRCPNCSSLEAQNTELDRKLAELEQAYEAVYRAGQAHEREECAKLCEARFMGDMTREDMEARRCAAAIRARGNT